MHKFTLVGHSTTIIDKRFDSIDETKELVDGQLVPFEGEDSTPIEFQAAAHSAFANEIDRLLRAVQFLRDAGLLKQKDLARLLKPLVAGLKKPETIYID